MLVHWPMAAGTCEGKAWPLLLIGSKNRAGGHMILLIDFINYVLQLYVWIIIISALLSILMAFNVINPYNQFVRSIYNGLLAITEPALRPIRRILPDTGGIDFSPLVLILIIFFIQTVVLGNLRNALLGV